MSTYDLAPLLEQLTALGDAKYAAFNASLVPGSNAALGVRMPALRTIAKMIVRSDDWQAFLEVSRDHDLYEIGMLHAMVLGGAKCPIDEKIALTDVFLPHVDNWAVCDALCSSFKPKSSDLEALFPFVRACAGSDIEFRKRFGLVMMMDYYRQEPYLRQVMAAYRAFHHEGYYARMGAAWGLATLWLYAREDALNILTGNLWDDFTHNRAIQKLRESYRVSDADKSLVQSLRRKKVNQ